jgi:hypothetical protein
MTDLQCPACEYVLTIADTEGSQGLLGALGLGYGGLSLDAAQQAEREMGEHLAGHSVLEWVTALRMADLYIDQVEADRDSQVIANRALEAQLAATEERLRRESELRVAQRQPAGYGAANGQPGPLAAPADWAEISPRERQALLAQDRKAGITRAIPDSLIPFISPANRAEGQVGRRR